ncbi:class I SAM-dependent methyltransferase [Georgenia satyanarayanai]|uniref:class I SAM-dependent methyltransferase n=1 Tax=Georgenia satyanarayanai TaxID=860221 RepID=UPI001D02AB5F|nr:class I SAM-dependent methyltransferase [Georgenia satyanarayanai]
MTNYHRMYRLGLTPWEGYRERASGSVNALLDREEAERGRPPGRALDIGCGRGQYTPGLARRGWQAVGVDLVPAAIEAARRAGPPEVTYVVGDATNLGGRGLGRFDFFLDVGCFQGFTEEQRRAQGRGVTALAEPGATLLMLAFGPTWFRRLAGGVSEAEVVAAFPRWELLAVDPAETAGLGFPMNRTRPQWYRLRLRDERGT